MERKKGYEKDLEELSLFLKKITKRRLIKVNKTKIDWCDSTWNPVTGCLHGCEYCYARGIAERFGGKQKYANIFEENDPVIGEDNKALAYPHSFSPTLLRYRLNDYIGKQGRNIFVCSMADLFGDWVPDSWIEEVFAACRRAPQHNYIFLTKNFMRASEFRYEKNWWVGRTITHDEPCGNGDKNLYLCYGIPMSAESTFMRHPNTFISIEPIQSEIPDLPYYAHEYGYRWVIVGAETGNRKERVIPKQEWIEKIVEDCRFRNVPVFMKSSLADIWGEPLIQEFPEGLRRHPCQ